jgi:hypothetical protein
MSLISKVAVIFKAVSLLPLSYLNYLKYYNILLVTIETTSDVTWFWKNVVVYTEISEKPAFSICPESGRSKFPRNAVHAVHTTLTSHSVREHST